MKVLITGGAGFIGTNYVYTHLELRPEDELVVLDALTYAGNRSNLAEAESKGVKFVQGRIEDQDAVDALFAKEKFDWVVHFAAETHVDRSIEDPSIFIKSNVIGTQVLLDAARDHEVKRFHHISTDEVYGDLGFDSQDQFHEKMILDPSSPYSASKAASDLLCLAYKRTFGVPITISRCSNNYGPYQDLEKLIPLFITKANNDEQVPLYGTGKNVRDWLYVRDHCEAILAILEKGEIGEIYNIGGDNEIENITITKTILSALGKPESLIKYVEDRKGHDERYAVSFKKLTDATAWLPKVTFEEGMQETVQWYTLKSYERSYSSWRNRVKTGATHQSHKQAPAADLR
ncbi:MAG: dTDP-glucose 4,6-dehydratase [Oceanicoccus sp.]|jgi:dTDP-glucose 4,6-dehydratase